MQAGGACGVGDGIWFLISGRMKKGGTGPKGFGRRDRGRLRLPSPNPLARGDRGTPVLGLLLLLLPLLGQPGGRIGVDPTPCPVRRPGLGRRGLCLCLRSCRTWRAEGEGSPGAPPLLLLLLLEVEGVIGGSAREGRGGRGDSSAGGGLRWKSSPLLSVGEGQGKSRGRLGRGDNCLLTPWTRAQGWRWACRCCAASCAWL